MNNDESHPLKFGKWKKGGRFATTPVASGHTQVVGGFCIQIVAECLSHFAKLLPRDNNFLRLSTLVHHDLLLNLSHT